MAARTGGHDRAAAEAAMATPHSAIAVTSPEAMRSLAELGFALAPHLGTKVFAVGKATAHMENAFDYLDAPVARVSGKDVPMPYAANLEKLALPSAAEVVEAAKAVCYR